VLYSQKDGVWKIADFGITAEGTSRRANTTRDKRGTSGYRAPELCQDQSTYNNKVDMWAFGCIAYELLARKRPFEGDWQIMQYALEGGKNPIQLELPIEEAPMACLNFILKTTLRVDPRLRPAATAILQLMNCCIRTTVEMVPTQPTPRQFKYYRQEDIDWAKVRWLEYWYS
jgi:serine/threonine protein kinase